VIGCHFADSIEGIVKIDIERVVILIVFVGNNLLNVERQIGISSAIIREGFDSNLFVVGHSHIIVSRHGQSPHVRNIGRLARRQGNRISGLHGRFHGRITRRFRSRSNDGTPGHGEIDGGDIAKGRASSIARLVLTAVVSNESFVWCVEHGKVIGCHFADSIEGIVQIVDGVGICFCIEIGVGIGIGIGIGISVGIAIAIGVGIRIEVGMGMRIGRIVHFLIVVIVTLFVGNDLMNVKWQIWISSAVIPENFHANLLSRNHRGVIVSGHGQSPHVRNIGRFSGGSTIRRCHRGC